VTAALYGLVLAGGRSTRMERDKAALAYHGHSQLAHAVDLVTPHVQRAFVSVREEQRAEPERARFPQIVDRLEEGGPIAGIVAAQAEHPDVAWLVLACDLPFLDAATVKHLVWARNADRQATAYRSSHDGLPEPLCAIYEPSSRAALSAYVAEGRRCPRKFLLQAANVSLLDEPNPQALDNVNTPDEYRSALATLSPSAKRRISVQYYALLREQAGRSEEAVATEAATPRELYEELRARYPFSLPPELLRVAVNAEFADWARPLDDGDSVVFVPPVAGG
jgi:molybdopterin-guanine dinucleotide biosynthesis protein A